MKVLVHGYFGFGNVGDEAIVSVILRELRTVYKEIVVLSVDPKRTALLHNIISCREKITSLEFWRHFLGSRALMFAGGGRYGKHTLKKMCMLAILAKILHKRVEFRAQGIYSYEWSGAPVIAHSPEPFNDLLTKALMMIAFKLADRVTVRDKFSKNVLIISGVSKKVSIEEDLAFKLRPSNFSISLKVLALHGVDTSHKPIVGVNLRTLSPEVRKRVVEAVSKILDWLIENCNAKAVFVPFGYGSIPERFFDNDFIVANELRNQLRNANKLKIIDIELKPQVILGMFRFFDIFIGMRFHSIIFSIITRIPTVSIVYDTKSLELLKNKKSMCQCLPIKINELNSDRLREAIQNLLGTYYEQKLHS